MRFNCANCKQSLEIADDLAGGDVQCPACGHVSHPSSSVMVPVPFPPAAAMAPAAEAPRTSGLAVSSLVMGILGLLIGWACCGLLFPILAIVFGHIALSQTNRRPHELTGRGMAVAGLVLGYVSLVLSIVIGVAFGLLSMIMEGASQSM